MAELELFTNAEPQAFPMRPALLEALEMLNAEQREAVEQTEGPVMVIAGPGTGKTQILACRIGYMLHHVADLRPENILCLTYTESGTVAMRERLQKFIGPDAYRVGIYTFHSFCNRVLQEHPQKFAQRDQEPISELEERLLLRELIDELDHTNPIKRFGKGAYYEVTRLKDLFATMKQENWSSDLIIQKLKERIEQLPYDENLRYKRNAKNGKKGDLRKAEFEKEKTRLEQIVAAAGLFDHFQHKLEKNHRYDYNDMIKRVLLAFQTDEDLLRDYQEQYQYFLVDEYQDTNGSQNQILNLLVDYWESPNVFIVGDENQSIFRFQGANVANICNFAEKYIEHGLHTVVLNHNYRSNQNILDASAHLINNNTDQLSEILAATQVNGLGSKKNSLTSSHPSRQNDKEETTMMSWQNDAAQTVGVAQQIQDLIENKKVKASEIAIIYRNHKQVNDIAEHLSRCGIGLNIRRKANILDSPLTLNLLTLLKYISSELKTPGSGDHLLFEILHFSFFEIPSLVNAELAIDLQKKRARERKKLAWRKHIQELSGYWKQDLFDQGENEGLQKVRDLSQKLENWIAQTPNITLQMLFEQILVEGGVLRWVLAQPDRTQLLQEVETFFDFIKRETSKQPLLKVRGLLQLIDTIREEELDLPMQLIVHADEGVNLLTAHASKGLEFDYVYIIGCDSKTWDQEPRRNSYRLPDNIERGVSQDSTEENRRLFYVAMTRARRYLQINYSLQDNQSKDKSPSQYLAELDDFAGLEKQAKHLESAAYLEYWQKFLDDAEKPELKDQDSAQIAGLLEKFQLSVTNLNKYLRCPVSFYFETVLRIPQAVTSNMSFGTSLHYALEMLFRNMLEDPRKNFAQLPQLVKWFEDSMYRLRESFTDAEFDNRLMHGKSVVLPAYYEARKLTWPEVCSPERDLANVLVGEIPLRGKLDRIDFDGNQVTVVDYKSGKYENTKRRKSFHKPDPDAGPEDAFELRYGGDYWRQAVFYKILVDRDQRTQWQVKKVLFDFVEPDKGNPPRLHEVEISSEDIDEVTGQIQEAWEGIQAKRFSPGCGEENCRWCNFLKGKTQPRR
jgi:DNA helicase-2/ATP-dependent DNA helicase PcrA